MVERIGYKLSWLFRELRQLNDPWQIEALVASVTALSELRWKMILKAQTNQSRIVGQKVTHTRKRAWTISPAHEVKIEDPSITEIRMQLAKTKWYWESRDNWTDMLDKEESKVKEMEAPLTPVRENNAFADVVEDEIRRGEKKPPL